MNEGYREDYRGDYRGDYRNDYRDDYRNYRDDYRYRRNYRDRYGRNYREDYHAMLEEIVDDGMELAKCYEEVAEMVSNTKDKNTLMKIGEKEKEHYRIVKEMLERNM